MLKTMIAIGLVVTTMFIGEPVRIEKQAEYTQEDIDLMARIVMSEASVLPYEGKLLVASTIDNRKNLKNFPNTIKEISNAYSTNDNGEPTDDCFKAVLQIIENNPFPYDLFYFRTGCSHSWGFVYAIIDDTYFTTDSDWEAKVNGCDR